MQKLSSLILMLCLILSGALCYAHGIVGQEQEKGKGKDGIPIELIENSSHSNSEKGNCIIPTLDGHALTIVFSENLGQVHVEVTTASGTPIDCLSTQTPNGVNIYITLAGDYIVTFTLENGDESYGEFTVTD